MSSSAFSAVQSRVTVWFSSNHLLLLVVASEWCLLTCFIMSEDAERGPANIPHWSCAGSTLVYRQRCRPNIKPAQGQWAMFAGRGHLWSYNEEVILIPCHMTPISPLNTPSQILSTFRVCSHTQQIRDIDPLLEQCWATVVDGGPALHQQWAGMHAHFVTNVTW